MVAGCASPPPRLRDFNDEILAVTREYPTDGSCGYWWPKDSSWEGTTRDIVYDGRKLATGDPQRRSYCCGLVFEVYMRACESALSSRGLRADDAHELRLRFFGDSKVTRDRKRLVQDALVSMKLGVAVPLEEARAGDLVQFWRAGGSGHQAVFLEWVREKGAIVAIKYWSSQKSTNGIGVNVERIGEKAVTREEILVVRATR
jgi:hypothetical protein